MMQHKCGPGCVCPSCGRPTLYNHKDGHACSDPDCEFAHGIRYPYKKGTW